MSGILTLVGPTAVGKSAFAELVAAKLMADFPELTGIDFISADSRQIYQGLEIVSGADIPADATQVEFQTDTFQTTCFENAAKKIRWFGISCLAPDQEWSVAHFRAMAQAIIPESLAQKRLPIIVGGTGLYVEHAFHGDPKLSVPPNEKLRQAADQMPLVELQEMTQRDAPGKWQTMNESDRANPRRLIRALEIAAATTETPADDSGLSLIPSLILGLSNTIEKLEPQIQQRVLDRWAAGAPQETARLPDRYPDQKLPVFSATGVKPILAFLADQVTAEEAQQLWFRQERQYAKRQFTWWKKRPGVQWFDVTQPEWKAAAYGAIAAWFRGT